MHENAGAISFLDPSGGVVRDFPDFARDRSVLVALHSAMVRTRAFDAKAIALQRTGRLGTYASSLGQEAVSVGIASAMTEADILLPSFREHGAQLWRGVSMDELFLYWGGDERGNDFARARRDFPNCVPVASQFPHAAGAALALSHKETGGVAVAVGGDGATSKGDFYEALNVVGAWNLPAVFVITNNAWAISTPREDQTHATTLAAKAAAAGLPGEQVDGNDVIAVHEATSRALSRARAGHGGTLIECLTYRLGDHTTADDATRYREEEEVSAHWKSEPLIRLRAYLTAEHGWSKDEEEALLKESHRDVDAAAERYLATEPAPGTSIVAHLYAELTAEFEALTEELEGG